MTLVKKKVWVNNEYHVIFRLQAEISPYIVTAHMNYGYVYIRYMYVC